MVTIKSRIFLGNPIILKKERYSHEVFFTLAEIFPFYQTIDYDADNFDRRSIFCRQSQVYLQKGETSWQEWRKKQMSTRDLRLFSDNSRDPSFQVKELF